MSQISKARQRILQKSKKTEPGQLESIKQKNLPRKFTVSSLTNHFQHNKIEKDNSPTSHVSRLTNYQARTPLPQSPTIKTQRSQYFPAKQNTPMMLKTVNIKIQQISRMETPRELQYPSQMSHAYQREAYEQKRVHRPLHKQKINLLVVPNQSRKNNSPYKPRECLLKWAQQSINEKKNIQRYFIDEYFPPAHTIIFNKKILYQQENLKFQRISQLYHCQQKLIISCEPTLLKLGKYTNPYLYSALSILAEEPERVISMFGSQQANQYGGYYVYLCKDGVWRYIIVDDFVPIKITQIRKQFLFLNSRQQEQEVQIWPALVQKAVAKVYATYIDLAMLKDQGMSALFKLLTGAPCSIYNIVKDFRGYIVMIDDALKKKHIVTLEGIQEHNKQTANLKNLDVHQAYRIIQIKKSGFRLRNYAQPELITKIAFDQCRIFTKIVIYRLQSNFRYISQKLRHKKRFFSKVKIEVPNQTRCYFDIWQNNPAYYKPHLSSQIDYKISPVKIYLTHLEANDDPEQICVGKDTTLVVGTYELCVHLCQQKQMDFTLSYYGQKQISISRQKNMQEWFQQCICRKK